MNAEDKPYWLVIAERYIGTEEFKGAKHNPIIVGFWKMIKRGGIKDDETPWCAAFVGGCLEQAGIVSSRFEGASSYLRWGIPLSVQRPRLGCVTVIKRPGGNHVFFTVGVSADGTKLIGLGGNQSDKVRYAVFNMADVRGHSWPIAVPVGPDAPVVNVDLFLKEKVRME